MRLHDIVGRMEHSELMNLRDDLDRGGLHIRTLIDNELQKHKHEHEKFCSVCTSEINPNNVNTFTVIFGPHDFKKKATFCAIDCLEYFMKSFKKKSLKKANTP
jgi:hypothetical protein